MPSLSLVSPDISDETYLSYNLNPLPGAGQMRPGAPGRRCEDLRLRLQRLWP